MATASSFSFSRRLGAVVRELGLNKGTGGLYSAHMAATERAILERVPLVDLVLEVRDARIPITSAVELLRKISCAHKHVVVLNKADLADRSLTKAWLRHFEHQNLVSYGINAHNKENVKELLSLIRSKLKQIKVGDNSYTATILLVGIPNVGKSAIANSMHLIGRIGAAEKGKLKHAAVSPNPGETKDISGYKIASQPNLYILDSPGILPSIVVDDESGCKLALTGAIKDSLVGVCELAKYFLAVCNLSEEYKGMRSLKDTVETKDKCGLHCESVMRRKRQYPSDHTQDFIVEDVRRTLYNSISSFEGCLTIESEMEKLISSQFIALQEALRLPLESNGDSYKAVATKLLNLYRTGRLGHYTLDHFPNELQEVIEEQNFVGLHV